MLLACIRWRHSSCPLSDPLCHIRVCAGRHGAHRSRDAHAVASIEARGGALVSPHVRDAHGPLPQCTLSAGTRQAKNIGMASLGRQSLPVHTRPSGREESEKGSVGPRLGPFSSSTNCETLSDKRCSRLSFASVPLQQRHDITNCSMRMGVFRGRLMGMQRQRTRLSGAGQAVPPATPGATARGRPRSYTTPVPSCVRSALTQPSARHGRAKWISHTSRRG